MTPNKRTPLILAIVAVAMLAAAAGWFLLQSKPAEVKPAPDLTALREALQTEATKRLETPLEGKILVITLKPGTLDDAREAMRAQALLPLEEITGESRWLFRGTPEEAKRLQEALTNFGSLEESGSHTGAASDAFLMNVILVGGNS